MSAEDGVFRSFVRSAFLGCLVFSCFRTHEIGSYNTPSFSSLDRILSSIPLGGGIIIE